MSQDGTQQRRKSAAAFCDIEQARWPARCTNRTVHRIAADSYKNFGAFLQRRRSWLTTMASLFFQR
jgi:hypothetical protein